MDYGEALDHLAGHINLEVLPPRSPGVARSLERMRHLTELLGGPQHAYAVIHLTGTNGKGSTARMLSALLVAKGLSVGTYTSPHLERINERWSWNGEPVSDAAFAETVEALSLVEELLDGPPSHFELLTAGALRWFADVAVDVAVVEVGLGGRWDATNVADGEVAVVTNVALDHMEYLGPSRLDIAKEKAGIVKPGSRLVLGETDATLTPVFRAQGPAAVVTRDVDFECTDNRVAVGGRLVDLRTPRGEYTDVYLPVHGAHQGDNAAVALTAAESFFGAALEPDLVEEAFAGVRIPGRMEVVGHRPLTILDGAHNPAGAAALAAALADDFAIETGRILVVGMLQGREPAEMLTALDVRAARLVLACVPDSPRAIPAEAIADAARALGVAAEVGGSVRSTVARAIALAAPEEQIVVTGSLYVVGAARGLLVP